MGGLSRNKTILLMSLLIIVVLSFGIYGLVNNDTVSFTKKVDNPNKEFRYENKLYFYDGDQLLGIYKCKNLDGYCGYGYAYFDDDIHEIDYYKEDDVANFTLVNNRYAFISDTNDDSEYKYDDSIILYDVINSREIATYKRVKNYSIGIDNNYFIVQHENGLWGVVQLGEINSVKIPFEYDYIGLRNDFTNGKITANIFAAKKDGSYFLIDIGNAKLTYDFGEKIVSYTTSNVILKDSSAYYLYDYSARRLLGTIEFAKLSFTDKYLNITTTYNSFYVYDLDLNEAISHYYSLNDGESGTSIINENGNIEVYVREKLVETIELS